MSVSPSVSGIVEFALVPVLPLCSEPGGDLHSLTSHGGVRVKFSANELKANFLKKGSALLSLLELDAAAISSACFGFQEHWRKVR
jgi:Na+-transporting NADH:ubiquinone oxidoreductase subunit NqrF